MLAAESRTELAPDLSIAVPARITHNSCVVRPADIAYDALAMRARPARAVVAPLILFVAFAVCPAHAEDLNPLNDRVSLSIGAFLLTTNTTVRVDGSGLEGTPVNLEQSLGISSNSSFRLDGYWRFLERHKLRFMYFQADRSATHTINQDIVFDGQTFAVNTTLNTRFDTLIAELAYEYAFLRGEHYELAGSAGLHDIDFRLSLAAVGNTLNRSAAASADVNGPLPVFGLHYLWEFAPHWNFDALAEIFALKYDHYDGNLQDYTASVVYMPWENFGAGVGWNEFVTHVNVTASEFDGNLYWRYGGVRLFFRLAY
jgi:hypothetical protein